MLKLSIEELLSHGIAPALQLIGGVATHEKRYEIAARLLGFADSDLKERRVEIIADVEPEWFLDASRAKIGEQRLSELMAEGAAWPQDRLTYMNCKYLRQARFAGSAKTPNPLKD